MVARRIGCLFLTSLAALALVLSASGPAVAATARQTAARDVKRAAALVVRIPSSKFAAGRRAAVLRKAARARRLASGKPCAALAAADDLLTALATPANWRNGRIPRASVRRPRSLLSSAERRLLRIAGKRCGARATTSDVAVEAGGSGLTPLPRPAEGNEQGAKPIPTGTFRRPAGIGEPTGVEAGPLGSLRSLAGGATFAAADPLSFFRVTDLGQQNCCGVPKEPTAAIGKNVVWYTGNTMVALSTDAGRTFAYFDPSTILPDEGLPFCCDQIVAYSPKVNLFVWEMQYWCATGTSSPATNICTAGGTGANRIRIAFARPEDLMAYSAQPGNAWHFFDMTPQDYGQPAAAWFDRSSMSLNDVNINLQVDILRNGNGPGSLLARIPLAQLQPGGKVTISNASDPGQRMEAVQGSGDVTYYAGASSLSKERILSWAPNASYVFAHEIDHSSIPNCDIAANGSNAANWYGRFGIWPGGVDSATLGGGTLYVAHGTGRAYCSDPSHPLFAQPAIFVATYDVGSWKLAGEKWMWHPTFAFGYPAMATDGAGEIGIAYRAAAAGQDPRLVASFYAPDGESKWAPLAAGGPFEAGDYYSLRPGQTNRSFVTTTETMQGANMHWNYVEFGRGPAPEIPSPDISITSPKTGANFKQGDTVTYTGVVHDPAWGALQPPAIVWREDGNVIGTGAQVAHVETVAGSHTITLTATNPDGKSATATVTINVLAPAPAGSPAPSIASPADSTAFCAHNQDAQGHWYETVAFQATATDPNTPPQALTYSWTDSVNGAAAVPVSTQLSPSLPLAYVPTGGAYKATTHDLTLTATNASNKSGSTQIRVTVGWPCVG